MAEIVNEIIDIMKQQTDNDGFMRREEICTALGVSIQTAMKYIHQLNDAGRLEIAKVPHRCITGHVVHTWAYRLKDE